MAKVTQRKISEYKQDSDNANKGTERGVYMLEHSLEEFGAGRSLLADKNGVLIAGNKTQERAVDLGITDVIEVETDGTQLVVVKRTDLDMADDPERKARGLAYADNRAGEVGLSWDAERMLADLQEGIDLEQFFTDAELEEMLGDLQPDSQEEPVAQVDRAAELQEKWQTERGQVWQVGRHRVICGDSNEETVFPRARLSFFDPIYGCDGNLVANVFGKLRSCCDSVLGVAWGFEVARWVSLVGSYDFDYCIAQGEGLFFAHKPIQRHKTACFWRFNDDAIYDHEQHLREDYATSVLFSHIRQLNDAPGMNHNKPVEMWGYFMRLHTQKGDCVIDPFLGSGATMVAAEQLDRTCYGIEIEPKYVAVTLERLSGIGLEPILVTN